ncbi:uncharacterized protein LOC108027418 [Drosophila biarmipes]|uniref:uncharacterized protein LOC108027418 n=1 Tax=Drosophila biarmipes TaxID=125945 RepID=UPI0007E6ADE8|nr:uncharacterized protein LOC108027418 [Drosophila biarmipes]
MRLPSIYWLPILQNPSQLDLRLPSEQDARTTSEHLPELPLPSSSSGHYSAVLAGLSAESPAASLPIYQFTHYPFADLEQEREGLRSGAQRWALLLPLATAIQAAHPFYRREESAVIRGQSIRYKRTKHSRRHRCILSYRRFFR